VSAVDRPLLAPPKEEVVDAQRQVAMRLVAERGQRQDAMPILAEAARGAPPPSPPLPPDIDIFALPILAPAAAAAAAAADDDDAQRDIVPGNRDPALGSAVPRMLADMDIVGLYIC
jgi:hypothetical protein